MQELIWDAVPAQRKKKEESFSVPTMTMSAIAKVGAGRKFSFNKAAQVALGVDGGDRVSFGFTPDGAHIFIRKVADETVGFGLTQACTISDKRTYEFIAKRLELNTEVENHFDINPLEGYSELVLRKVTEETAEGPIITFATMDMGEVGDVENMDADLTSIPEVPEGGVQYSEPEIHVESDQEYVERVAEIEGELEEEVATMPEPSEGSDEDVW